MAEIDLMRRIQVAASQDGDRLFRNNVAEAWVGVFAGRRPDGTVVLKNARPLHAGLCIGSSDLIGFRSDGKFIAIEVKSLTGTASPEQLQFIETVQKFNGLAGIARSIQDAQDIIHGNQRR